MTNDPVIHPLYILLVVYALTTSYSMVMRDVGMVIQQKWGYMWQLLIENKKWNVHILYVLLLHDFVAKSNDYLIFITTNKF